MAVHLVSAFFQIQSKQPPSFYLEKSQSILSKCPAHLTLFTSSEYGDAFKKFRGDLPLTLVIDDVDSDGHPLGIPAKTFFPSFVWASLAEKLSLRHKRWVPHGISAQLQQLYLSKAWFVSRAIELSPGADSDLFMWNDIGSCRTEEQAAILEFWPSHERLQLHGCSDNRLIFFQRREAPLEITIDLSSIVAGSTIFGTRKAWQPALKDIADTAIENVQKYSDGAYDETVYAYLCEKFPFRYKKVRTNWDPTNEGWFQTYDVHANRAALPRLIPDSLSPPKIRAYVINLEKRSDRWELMQKAWSGIIDEIVRVDAFASSAVFQGCGISHVQAIRRGFAEKTGRSCFPDIVLVLEDDCHPNLGATKQSIIQILRDAQSFSAKYDAFFLVPLVDPPEFEALSSSEKGPLSRTKSSFFRASPNFMLMCSAMMIYSRRALHWIDEYEAHVRTSPKIIPNDRIIMCDSWPPKKPTLLWNMPEAVTVCSQAAIHADLGSDNGGWQKISESDMGKETPRLLRKLSELIRQEEATRKVLPLRISHISAWGLDCIQVDDAFEFHSAYETGKDGIRRRVDATIYEFFHPVKASRMKGRTYSVRFAKELEILFWWRNVAYICTVEAGKPLIWKHDIECVTVPDFRSHISPDISDDRRFGTVISASSANKAPNVSPHDAYSYVYPCNTRAYLMHIVAYYEKLKDVTLFAVEHAGFRVAEPAEVGALVHEAFAHGYAELGTIGPFALASSHHQALSGEAMLLSDQSRETFTKRLLDIDANCSWHTMPPTFAVRRDHILKRPHAFYVRALSLLPANIELSEESQWLDSLWRSIFTESSMAIPCDATVLSADYGSDSLSSRVEATSVVRVKIAHSARNSFLILSDIFPSPLPESTLQIKWSHYGSCCFTNMKLTDKILIT